MENVLVNSGNNEKIYDGCGKGFGIEKTKK
jgi:hypothetical protein